MIVPAPSTMPNRRWIPRSNTLASKNWKGDSEGQISVKSRIANRLPHDMHQVTMQALMQSSSSADQDVRILTATSLGLLEVSPAI